ncbi:hypothetical protein BU24DRAFT_417926 [Aaosphaeria arxii CBS 175.79]|uniref:Uncharacterized protein n=1 Tax=Aaosphaeria arxii CBS 175.79 TaxID=1450172 RepID=A0A6A5YCH2_9PLEO|nr:uncharacterized protein BU24DRAFT_417926 [Aaosphaeria arxii CBS 175.79]KAF2022281.1 hypothetical protein BU24DRAFT_417926 [Aaosphaeria arxii CBS 175.79]
MALFSDTPRADGFIKPPRALAALEEYSLRPKCEMQWFSNSPSPYAFYSFGSTARSASAISAKEYLCQKRREELIQEREASEARNQFKAEVEDERRRLWKADPSTSWREMKISDLNIFREEATEAVRKCWVEQGIWNEKWNLLSLGRWKHEEPLELDSGPETDSEAEIPQLLFGPKPQPTKKRPKSEDEKRQIAERRALRQRERDASRPYYRFVYQVKECERILEEEAGADAARNDTKAYENVKSTWVKRGLWYEKWGTMPGMSWKHELSLDEMLRERGIESVPATPLVRNSHKVPIESKFRYAPLFQVNHRQVPSASNTSHQDQSPEDLALWESVGKISRSTAASQLTIGLS